MPDAWLGLRVHSGWAALVAVIKPLGVVERRRLEIADSTLPGSVQPYHAAEGLPIEKAAKLVERCRLSTHALAEAAIIAAIDALRSKDYAVRGACILLSSSKPFSSLEEILASHAKIHAAEGDFFRDALKAACEASGIPVLGLREKEVVQQEELVREAAGFAKIVGPPWRQDEKLATAAAWLACARYTEG